MGLPSTSPFYPIDPERLLLSNEHAVAFLDRFPLAEGHALVVPVRLVGRLADLPPDVEAVLWATARQARELLQARFRPAGFTIGINDGEAAGQTVPHAHIHLIPRYPGDVPDPRGGIRWIIPAKAKYWSGE